MKLATPDNFLSIFAIIGMSSWKECLVVPRGSPGYVNGSVATLQAKFVASTFMCSMLTLIGTIDDLL